jgi:amino acid adenylation domain-containing protein
MTPAPATTAGHDFWLGVLTGAVQTRLLRYPRPGAGTSTVHEVALPAPLSGASLAVARRLGVPLRTVLLAAHVAVIGFIAGTEDVLTGYGWARRPDGGGADGVPVHPVPFRVRLVAGGTWADLIAGVHAAETAMLPHAGHPMAEVERVVGNPAELFDTVFGSGPGTDTWSGFPFRAGFSRSDRSGQVRLRIRYDGHAYGAAQVERFGGYYRRALDRIAHGVDTARGPSDLMGQEERRLLGDFSGPDVALPDGTFPDLFDSRVREDPERLALVCGPTRLTYAGLDHESDRVAAHLLRAGVAAGDVVTTMLPRGVPWAVTVLALLKVGAVYLPQDLEYPAERVASVLRRAGCHHVITARDAAADLPARVGRQVSGLSILLYEEACATPPVGSPRSRPAPGDPAYLIFTSGSTGEPKGALIPHRGLLNHLLAKDRDLRLGQHDRIAQTATQCFDISVWQLLAGWIRGASTWIYTRIEVLDVPGFLRGIATDRVTVLELVPSYLDLMLAEADRRPVDLPDLRVAVVTGEALPPILTRRWFARCPSVPLVNAYGPTEASDDVTHHRLERPAAGARVPVGRPIMNTGIHVVGPDDSLRPVGSYGEICVTGPGVALGYVNDDERTAAAFQPNTLDRRSDTFYRTGDTGRWLPGGVLDCAGRRDDQVKVRGYRVELSDVDSALVRLPGVDVAVTVASERNGQARLVAFFTGSAAPDLTEFQRGLSRLLPGYLIPERVVRVPELPLTGSGKVDRKALARRDAAGRQPAGGG